ncbi:hypothetical protein LTR42_002627 [Elasticomyces elasticus]|nr:hypothetical protein LTR42_002627 [Elasticomyces elasticus]
MAHRPNLVQVLIEDTKRITVVSRSALLEYQNRSPATTSSPGFLSLPQELRDLIYDLALSGAGLDDRRCLTREVIWEARPGSQPVNLATFKAVYDILLGGRKGGLATRSFNPHDALFATIAELRWLLENASIPTLESIRTIVVDVDHSLSSAAEYFALNVDAKLPNLDAEYLGHGHFYKGGRIYPSRKAMTYYTYVPRSIEVRRPPRNLAQLSSDEKIRECMEYSDRQLAAFMAPTLEARALQDLVSEVQVLR